MKPQDAIFFAILFGLLVTRKLQHLVWAALICLALSIPLFATWTFFTAERLTWYAAGFVLIYVLLTFRKNGIKNS
jgi:hypothetical protein